jgi:hypothetical protein
LDVDACFLADDRRQTVFSRQNVHRRDHRHESLVHHYVLLRVLLLLHHVFLHVLDLVHHDVLFCRVHLV